MASKESNPPAEHPERGSAERRDIAAFLGAVGILRKAITVPQLGVTYNLADAYPKETQAVTESAKPLKGQQAQGALDLPYYFFFKSSEGKIRRRSIGLTYFRFHQHLLFKGVIGDVETLSVLDLDANLKYGHHERLALGIDPLSLDENARPAAEARADLFLHHPLGYGSEKDQHLWLPVEGVTRLVATA